MDIRNQTEALIRAALAKPITHEVVSVYADGTTKRHGTRSIGAANTYMDFVVRPMLNRNLIVRETGAVVCIVSAHIVEL